jgi:hypothetical protein
MGLVSVEELPDLHVPIDARNVTRVRDIEGDYPNLDEEGLVHQFEADGFVTYTPEEFQAGYGEPNPDAKDLSRYHVLFVAISDHTFTDEEMDWYERGVAYVTAPGPVRLEDFFPPEEFPVEWQDWGTLYDNHEPLNWSVATKGLGELVPCQPIPK